MSDPINLSIETDPTYNLSTPVINQIIEAISPTATVTKSGDTATISITDKNGTTTASISDGVGTDMIDDTAGSGDTDKVWSADKTHDVTSDLLSAIEVLEPSASSSDVGKMLKVKTVSDGKVTEYEFGEGGGSGGTSDYTDLENKPQIAGVTLAGNKSLSDLGIASASDASAKYTKPSGGIPSSDMASAVQTSLGKADSAYQKPGAGIPAADLASGVIPTVHNVPSGGASGKILKKASATDYDLEWGDAPTATDAQVETAVDDWLGENITNPDSPPLDRSLSSSSAAAPADMVGDIDSHFFHDVNTKSLWKRGNINLSTGENANSNSRIRTIVYIPKSFISIKAKSGYRYIISAYSSGTYQGQWTGSGFSKTQVQWKTGEIKFSDVGDYDLRLIVGNTSETDITTDNYTGVEIISTIDESLSIKNIPADAKATGDAIVNLGTDINRKILHDINAKSLWKRGNITYDGGEDANSNSRIRTPGYIDKSFISITAKSGYRYCVYAYSNGTYQGQWTGSGFSKTEMQWKTGTVVFADVGNYDIRIMAGNTSDTDITTDNYNGIEINGTVDISLSISGSPADSGAVGTALSELRSNVQNIKATGNIYEKPCEWWYGSINSSTGSLITNRARLRTLPIAIDNGGSIHVETSSNSVMFGVYAYNASDGTYNSLKKAIDSTAYTGNDSSLKYAIMAQKSPSSDDPITDKSEVTNYITVTVTAGINAVVNPFDSYISYRSCLTGKRWAVCGDSFSHGDFTGYTVPANGLIKDGMYKGKNAVYSHYIGNRTGVFVEMLAANGQTLARVSGSDNNFVDKILNKTAYSAISNDISYITLWFGINDKIQEVPIGTSDSTDPTTFYGAWNIVLTYLRNYHPFAHVGIVVSNSSTNDALPYADATIAMAKKYGYPYLNLMYDDTLPLLLFEVGRTDVSSTIRSLVHEQFAVNPPSNMHPNEKAHEFESYMIEEWLKRI